MIQHDGMAIAGPEEAQRIKNWDKVLREACETVHNTEGGTVASVTVMVALENVEDRPVMLALAKQLAAMYQLQTVASLEDKALTIRYSRPSNYRRLGRGKW